MKWVSIQLKIVSVIVGILVVTLMAVLVFSVSSARRNLLLAADKTLAANTRMLAQALQTIMLIGEAPIAVRTLENLQLIEELEKIDIYRANGERAFHDYATLETVNRIRKKKVFARTERLPYKKLDNEYFQQVLSSRTAVKVENTNPPSVEHYVPLLNAPDCRKCHGEDHIIRGVLHFDISVEGIYRQIQQSGAILASIFVLAGTLIGASLILIMKRIIVRPLIMLGNTLAVVGGGSFDVELEYSSNDELGQIAGQTNAMIGSLKSRTEELQLTQDVTILSLASLAETRDNETGSHILRTQHYVRLLADGLRRLPQYAEQLPDEQIEMLFKSAPLHDIGKVGVPDAILRKKGSFTAPEWEEMKKHARYGYDALRVAEERMGSTSFLRLAREIALSHHEKWDGSGYPQGLAGEKIPLSGRLMALADVYDALISKRVYKESFAHEKAFEIIVEGKGQHFDPNLVEVIVAKEQEVLEIARNYRDED